MNQLTHPKVTVLMPVYNGEKFLREAIESILNQTFTDFEFLIINDGSTDGSVEIIDSYKDPRINLVNNKENLGLIATLNKGLDLALGKYLARMDCDDISLPERLARQVAFMDSHPEVCVCGTWIRTIGEIYGDVWDYPPDYTTIKCCLMFGSVIAHPSVIIRKSGLEKYQLFYDARYTHAEDYELWVRCSKYMLLANIPEVLVLYRIHKQQIVNRECQGKEESASKIRNHQIEALGVFPTPEEIEIHLALSTWRFHPTYNFVEQTDLWLRKLKSANRLTPCYPEPAFSRVLGERWFAVCNSTARLGSRVWRKYWLSPLSQLTHLNLSQKLKFAVKCYLK